MNSRVVYMGLIAAQLLLAVAGAILAIVGLTSAALAVLALALALSPVLAHVRMRRSLAALRRTGGGGGSVAIDPGISTRLSSLESSINNLSHKVDTISAKQSDSATGEASKYANEIRREARAIRLMLHEQPSK